MTNGEKYKSPKERIEKFDEFCKKHNCGDCTAGKVGSLESECAFRWLELEYKAELKPCPFCGKVPTLKTELNACMKPRYYYVACSCGATFTNAACESDAVALWNRRV